MGSKALIQASSNGGAPIPSRASARGQEHQQEEEEAAISCSDDAKKDDMRSTVATRRNDPEAAPPRTLPLFKRAKPTLSSSHSLSRKCLLCSKAARADSCVTTQQQIDHVHAKNGKFHKKKKKKKRGTSVEGQQVGLGCANTVTKILSFPARHLLPR